MLIQTNKLIGPALDWAVATALGWSDVQITAYDDPDSLDEPFFRPDKVVNGVVVCLSGCRWKPSTNPAQAHPIIEHNEIGFKRRAPCMKGEEWEAMGSITAKGAGYRHALGPTPLVASMRCFVSSKLGDLIDVPDRLVTEQMQ